MDKHFGKQGGESKEKTPERVKVTMLLRYAIKKLSKGYGAVCLELSLASCGATIKECKSRLKEAVAAYMDTVRMVRDNQGSEEVKVIFRKVPFYWPRRMAFDILTSGVVPEGTGRIFERFISKNRQFVYAIANENVSRDKDGRVVIAKDDPWRNEHEWDEMYQKLKGRGE